MRVELAGSVYIESRTPSNLRAQVSDKLNPPHGHFCDLPIFHVAGWAGFCQVEKFQMEPPYAMEESCPPQSANPWPVWLSTQGVLPSKVAKIQALITQPSY
ncbi:hypothetical protein THAOC_00925, partial [Thalassiosira oceanica]